MASIFTHKPDPLVIRHRTSGFGQIRVWFPVAIAVAVIAIESTSLMGADHTSGWLLPIFEALFGHIRENRWLEFHHILRKCGHFLGYGLVCLSFLRAWLLTFAGQVDVRLLLWRVRSSAAAICSTAVIASLDEWHQTTLPNRTGQASDALLDTCGATVTVLLVWFLVWRQPARRRRR
jgi:VanZ family protein